MKRLAAATSSASSRIDQQPTVEIAVADMADDRREQIVLRRCRAAVSVTHSASREIGTQTSVASASAPGRSAALRPIGVVPRLPQPGAFLGLGGPARTAPPPHSCAISPKRLRSARRRRRRCRGIRAAASASPAGRASNRRCTACTCTASSNSMRATGMPDWMVTIVALQAASTDRERADAGSDRLGNAGEPAASFR